MNKCILIIGLLVVAGCSREAAKSGGVKWVSAGTLVSVGPDVVSTRSPDRLQEAMIGETKFNRTRIETTEGVYIVHGKIGTVHEGVAVTVGYDKTSASEELRDVPLYLSFGGKRYEIVR
jgi:hypothetical protein